MRNLIISISIAIIAATTTINANEAEAKLEKDLGQSIVRLQSALEKYKNMKSAMTATNEDREVILRKVCKRMKRDLVKVDTLVAGLDLCLEFQGTTNAAKSESGRTNERIKTLNKQIRDLKKDLKTNDSPRTVIAAN